MQQASRYQKQILFSGVAARGQEALGQSKVLLVGCGALGCVLADTLARAGVGHLRIVDRDFVEFSNLQRQVLFTEYDVTAHLPKSIAAVNRLARVNSDIQLEPIVADVDYRNIRKLAEGVDLILDGTDNFEIRYLINDVSLETGIPWIFTGCTGSHGQMMPVFPGMSACLRCLIPSPPPPGSTETCDTAGVLGPAINVIASLQAAIAIRILTAASTGARAVDLVPLKLTMVDVWDLHSDKSMFPDFETRQIAQLVRRESGFGLMEAILPVRPFYAAETRFRFLRLRKLRFLSKNWAASWHRSAE